MLSSRLDTILKSIVSQYIETAVPVPSQSLMNERTLRVCSATIRNDMVHLEQEGYITRPYSSAGSMPTDKGYRYYVESLSDITLPLSEQRMISHLFHQIERRLDEWLNLAVTVAARLAQIATSAGTTMLIASGENTLGCSAIAVSRLVPSAT